MSTASEIVPELIAQRTPLPQQNHCSHSAQFYDNDNFPLDTLRESLGDALDAGAAVVVLATKGHRDGLANKLTGSGVALASAVEQGRYLALDVAESLSQFMVDGTPDAERFERFAGGVLARALAACRSDQPQVTVFGEMATRLWAEGKTDAALRLEQLWNELVRKQGVSLHCAYPIALFNRAEHSEAFSKICAEHDWITPTEEYAALVSEEERRRNVIQLQQKVQALETAKAERRQALTSLRHRESELADILENAVEGVQQTGPDQRILWANRALLNLLGYSAEEYFQQRFSEFHVHQQGFDDCWHRLLRGEAVRDCAAQLRCRDGSVKDVLIHSNGLWENGQLVYTRCFIRDVSAEQRMMKALKLAQQELQLRIQERTAELQERNLQILQQAESLAAANRNLRELSTRLLHLQDDERRRIAGDLHDGAGQDLALLSICLSSLEIKTREQCPSLAPELSESVEIARRVCTQLRTISYLLYPPLLEEMGLESALRWYADGFAQRSGIAVRVDISSGLGRLTREQEIALFRVVQECLSNIHRHSGSATASICLSRSAHNATLEVSDEGIGLTPEQVAKICRGTLGVGLRSVKERIEDLGGALVITSQPRGTQVTAVAPTPERDLTR